MLCQCCQRIICYHGDNIGQRTIKVNSFAYVIAMVADDALVFPQTSKK